MPEDRQPSGGSLVVDGLLAGGVLTLLIVCLGTVIAWYPSLWARCLTLLDVRNWTHWAWTGVGVALLAAFVLIRIWPEGSSALSEDAGRGLSQRSEILDRAVSDSHPG